MVKPKIIIVTQARIASSRFPEKILQLVDNESLLSIHLNRLKKSKFANKIIVATTFEEKSYLIKKIANKEKVGIFQGDTNDVLDRFYQAVKNEHANLIVRVTSDCPLIDASLIDQVIKLVVENKLDYGANIFKEEYPDGQDVEVFTFDALKRAWEEAKLPSDREHVTPYIRNNSTFFHKNLFRSDNLYAPTNFNHLRMTVDEPEDLNTIKTLIDFLGKDAKWDEYADVLEKNVELFKNQSIIRNEGYILSLKNDINENKA